MEKIRNYDTYIGKMDKSIFDKCWWFDKIDDDVNIVVDFGCATGDLFGFLRRMAPGKFRKFIGIEEDSEMRRRAYNKHNCYRDTTVFLPSLKCLPSVKNFDPSRAVIVLNSVVHEILSYKGEEEYFCLLQELSKMGFRHIAIRDMARFGLSCRTNSIYSRDAIIRLNNLPEGEYRNRWEEYKGDRIPSEKDVAEFLLKYSYAENWDREKDENYLWDWDMDTECILGDLYSTDCRIPFFIPYQRKKIKKDLGVDWPYSTHIKIFFTRKDEEDGRK